ncbi:hypothetical protein [Desmospora profundinema]|uniref:tRNA G10 N-methylase Trm11 n=1 Tax=Desmospora profundinema TaxID=1571184 RepID=A0ABU1IKV5_9BACL|nr:hypothetical protein [Desmospora profundinema]MDR6224440.1 tRNA G10 N-methylase Trm11 [Desmospora profundinema]
MDAFSSPGRILEELHGHFPAEELEAIQTLLQVEAWASPSSRQKRGAEVNIPLRYHLEIELSE